MRPIKLEMTAFGSYAKHTIVDFQKLKHCLYLITGDTGAGKTTIFDGIMFALYGVASGKGNGKFRTFEMMHCDYVDKYIDTKISLDFEHIGKKYTVKRKFHFKKNKNGKYEKTTPIVEFFEDGRDVLEGNDKVKNRVIELLGMDEDQFRKIVMLAQGEFKKFLDADSEEKNKILGKLFDNSDYVWFQEIFDKARKKLADCRSEKGNKKIEDIMNDFIMSEDITEQEHKIYIAGHSKLEENLKNLVEKDKLKKEKLEEELKKNQKKRDDLMVDSVKAEEQNKKLAELKQKKSDFNKLQEKSQDMEKLREKVNKVKKAFYNIKPKNDSFNEAEKNYVNTNDKIKKLSDKLCNLKNSKDERKKLLASCKEKNEPAIKRLEDHIRDIDSSLPKYNNLKEKTDELQENEKSLDDFNKKIKSEKNNKETIKKAIEKLNEKIKKLDGIEKIEEQKKNALENATDKYNRLICKGGLKDQYDKICKKKEDLTKEEIAFEKIIAEVENLKSNYDNIHQKFIEGQVSLLAKDLQQELHEKREAICPVCKTVLQKSDSHIFVEVTEKIPKQEEVDNAKKNFEEKNAKRQEKFVEIGNYKTEIECSKKTLINELKNLGQDCSSWEVLDDSYLSNMIKEYEVEKQKAEKEYSNAAEQCKTLKNLKRKDTEKNEKLNSLGDILNELGNKKNGYKYTISGLKGEINTLKKILKYSDKETAKNKKNELQEEKKQLTEKIQYAEENFQKLEKEYISTSSTLEEYKNNLPSLFKKKNDVKEELLIEIEQQGFQDMEEVNILLKPFEKSADVENWIESKETEINTHDNDLKNTNDRIKTLRKETKNFEMTDLEQLKSNIEDIEKNNEKIQDKLKICEKHYENHNKTYRIVKEANQYLKDTENAWKRLDSLANLAIGSNSEGGKLSFDRYVMGYVFKEILYMSNQRLNIMSGGRYELIHEINAYKNNAKAGLEITILDRTTGECRSVSSLSGGESFFVSLALALGLSDVVQNHAGGKQVNALFIDEGFGTLDNDVLDHALEVLNKLTEGQRLVGIISHVEKLKESIPQQIKVSNSGNGSSLKIVN